MNLQKLRDETDEWVKHFNRELTLMNEHLATIAKATKLVRKIDINQQNDYSDIRYLKEAVHRQEDELIDLREEINALKLIQIIGMKSREREKTMEENKWQKEKVLR